MSMLHSVTAFTSDQVVDEHEVDEQLFTQDVRTDAAHRRTIPAPENNAVNRLNALLAELKRINQPSAASDPEARTSTNRADDAPFTAPGSDAALLDLAGQPGWRGATEATERSDEINAATVRIDQIRSEVGSACALLAYAIATAQENDANRRVVDILKEKRSRLRSIERRLHV